MWPVSDRYLGAIRNSHAKVTKVTHTNLITRETLTLDVLDGAVTVDATSNVRRKLDLTVPQSEATWNALDTVGGEITVQRGVRYTDGAIEYVPLGVFIVDTDAIDYGPTGTITLSGCPDRWGKVQKNLLAPNARNSVPGNLGFNEIARLVEGAWPSSAYPFPGWAGIDTLTATNKVGIRFWEDGNRETAIKDLCDASGVEVFFDPNGKAVLRKIPLFSSTSTAQWTVDAGVNGVMLGANRSRDRTRMFNAVIVSTSATDIIIVPQEVKNTSATDPLSVTGPLGYQATEYSSAAIRSSAQARTAGKAKLNKYVGAAKQLTLEAIQNDALDVYDVLNVILPKINRETARPSELHVIDTLTIPLRPDGAMEIQTRSTIPDESAGS